MKTINSGHYFQTLDRVHVASACLQRTFENDLVLRRHPHLRALYERAVESLERLYQAVGQFDLTTEAVSSNRPTSRSKRRGARKSNRGSRATDRAPRA